MITFRRGDMFAEEVEVLVNPVNCVGVMGAGLALEFKKRWLRYFLEYRTQCEHGLIEPGHISCYRATWPSGSPVWLISLPTKKHWRDKSSIDDIRQGLYDLGCYLSGSDLKTIAVPAVGCGLGGLAWNDVKPVIVEMLDRYAPRADARIYEPY